MWSNFSGGQLVMSYTSAFITDDFLVIGLFIEN